MAWTDLSAAFGFGTILTSTQMQSIRDNIISVADGDTGAPRIVTGAIKGLSTSSSLATNDSKLLASIVASGLYGSNEATLITGASRNVWGTPYVVATIVNNFDFNINVYLSVQVFRNADDTPQIRLASYNNTTTLTAIETVSIAALPSAWTWVDFSPIVVSPGTVREYLIQGYVGSGTGTDEIYYRASKADAIR